MAFLRIEKKKSGTYLRIVKSYRENGVSRHKTLYSLGKAEDYDPTQLKKIANKLLALAGGKLDNNSNNFREISRLNYGYSLIINHLWNKFGIGSLVASYLHGRRIQFDFESVLKLLIAERLNEPGSKLSNYEHKDEYIGLCCEIDLQHLYRSLDLLSGNEEMMQEHLFKQQRNLFSERLDVVFYDVTTLYFDSQIEEEGSVRQKGYSKDGKAGKTQIVLGLLVDKDRNPICYEVYKGNTYEGHTMKDALHKLKGRFNIDKIVVVGDRGMMNSDNLDMLTGLNYEYIIGERLKNLPKAIQKKLLDRSEHKSIPLTSKDVFSYKTEKYKGKTIICTYSAKRAGKNFHERQKLILKAKSYVDNPSKLTQVKKRGAGKYVVQNEASNPCLNLDKIEKDAIFDGFIAISTNVKDLKISEILSQYGHLIKVEHAFRSLKSQLEIRPMYHWTNKRIRGHVALCFLSYTFLNYLCKATGLSERKLIRTIDQMQLSKIEESKENIIYLRSFISAEQKILIKKLKLTVPKDVTPESVINQYFT